MCFRHGNANVNVSLALVAGGKKGTCCQQNQKNRYESFHKILQKKDIILSPGGIIVEKRNLLIKVSSFFR
jgi:hypothetical protein